MRGFSPRIEVTRPRISAAMADADSRQNPLRIGYCCGRSVVAAVTTMSAG
jgi:hypothetical protein